MSNILKGLHESRSDWDNNMSGYRGDYGGAENWDSGKKAFRRQEADQEWEREQEYTRQQAELAQYNETGKFWLKLKDSQRHLPAGPFIGKQAANVAALELLKQQPELRGNLVITAYGPDETQDVAEGIPDVDHMNGPRGIGLDWADTRDLLQKPFEHYGNYKEWYRDVNRVNSELLDDNAEFSTMSGGKIISINGKDFAFWSNRNGNGSIDIGIAKKHSGQGVAEGPGFDKWADDRAASQLYKLNPATTWEVSFDYGPHQSETVKVKAMSAQEAVDKVETAAEKKGRSIMVNWARPAEQGQLDELSNNTLASYKKKAGADATQADKRGDYARGDKRMSGIIKATKKEFDNDAKGVTEAGNKPIDRQFPLGTGDTRTPRDIKSQMRDASDKFVQQTAASKTGPLHSRVAKMQNKMAKSELRKRDDHDRLATGTNEEMSEEKQRLDPSCWKGYKKQGTKMKGDTRVNNCVPVKESAIMKGLK